MDKAVGGRYVPAFLLVCCALGASGCATFGAWAGTNTDLSMVYVGTQSDWRYLANQPEPDQATPGPNAKKPPAEDPTEHWIFVPFVAIDLPLSFVADTLMYPFALIADAQHPKREPPPP